MDMKWMFLLFLLIQLYSFICLWKSREEVNFVFLKISFNLLVTATVLTNIFIFVIPNFFNIFRHNFLFICSPHHISQFTL